MIGGVCGVFEVSMTRPVAAARVDVVVDSTTSWGRDVGLGLRPTRLEEGRIYMEMKSRQGHVRSI